MTPQFHSWVIQPRENENWPHKNVHTNCVPAFFKTAPNQKQPPINCPSTVHQLKDGHLRCSLCTVEYYSAIKRNGLLTHATTPTNPKDIVLKKGQTRKGTWYVIPCIWNAEHRQSHRDGGQEWGRGEGGNCKWIEGFFWGDRNVLGLNSEYTLKCILEKGEFYCMWIISQFLKCTIKTKS